MHTLLVNINYLIKLPYYAQTRNVCLIYHLKCFNTFNFQNSISYHLTAEIFILNIVNIIALKKVLFMLYFQFIALKIIS